MLVPFHGCSKQMISYIIRIVLEGIRKAGIEATDAYIHLELASWDDIGGGGTQATIQTTLRYRFQITSRPVCTRN